MKDLVDIFRENRAVAEEWWNEQEDYLEDGLENLSFIDSITDLELGEEYVD